MTLLVPSLSATHGALVALEPPTAAAAGPSYDGGAIHCFRGRASSWAEFDSWRCPVIMLKPRDAADTDALNPIRALVFGHAYLGSPQPSRVTTIAPATSPMFVHAQLIPELAYLGGAIAPVGSWSREVDIPGTQLGLTTLTMGDGLYDMFHHLYAESDRYYLTVPIRSYTKLVSGARRHLRLISTSADLTDFYGVWPTTTYFLPAWYAAYDTYVMQWAEKLCSLSAEHIERLRFSLDMIGSWGQYQCSVLSDHASRFYEEE